MGAADHGKRARARDATFMGYHSLAFYKRIFCHIFVRKNRLHT
jgi:hypothetical protein